jgi:hypothetical protein
VQSHSSRTRLRLASVVALALISGCASVGTVAGTLQLPQGQGQAVPDSLHHHARAHWPISDAVIYVERPPIGMWWGPPAPVWVSMRQLEHRFEPRVLPVVPGTLVRFQNRDRVFHNVFSIEPGRRFDLGQIAPGSTRVVRFDKQGPVPVFCELDAEMAGYVFVVPNACFTRPGSDGRFRLPPLARGTYSVVVWHPTLGTLTRRIEVTRRANVELELTLPGDANAAR